MIFLDLEFDICLKFGAWNLRFIKGVKWNF